MNKQFTFFVDGINKKVVVEAANEKEAHDLAWNKLTSTEKDSAASLECVDISDIPKSATIKITDKPDGTVGVELEFSGEGADDNSSAHGCAAMFIQWLSEQYK